MDSFQNKLSPTPAPQNVAINECIVDPTIEIKPRPRIARTEDGHYDEANAAAYLAYKMCSSISQRTLRRWRNLGEGPAWYSGPAGRPIWYRQADLDEFILVSCGRGTGD